MADVDKRGGRKLRPLSTICSSQWILALTLKSDLTATATVHPDREARNRSRALIAFQSKGAVYYHGCPRTYVASPTASLPQTPGCVRFQRIQDLPSLAVRGNY